MPRVNVWIPDELHAQVRDRLPGVNVSALLQEALAAKLRCGHATLECTTCRGSFDLRDLAEEALAGFYDEAWHELATLARRDGTAVGAVTVLKRVGEQFGIGIASQRGTARPTRRERQRALDAKLTNLEPDRHRRRRVA